MMRAAVAILILLLGACSNPSDSFEIAAVEHGDVRDVIPASGNIEPSNQVEVHSPRAGRVVAVLVDVNAHVQAGQILARIEPSDLTITPAEARENLAVATATLAEARIRLAQAQRNLETRLRLAEEGYIATAAVATFQTEADAAEAAVRRAEAQVSREQLSVSNSTTAAGDGVIRSPIDGFVLARNLEVGQLVGARAGEPAFIVAAELDRVVVRALVAEPDIGRLAGALSVQFKVDAYPSEVFVGRVRRIQRDPVVDRTFVSYPVLIEVEDSGGRLFPGMTAAVEFIRVDSRNVIRIPIEALYVTPPGYTATVSPAIQRRLQRLGLDGNRDALNGAEAGALYAEGYQRVFVLHRGKPEMRRVRIGAQTARHVEVREGLSVNDSVIVSAPEEI